MLHVQAAFETVHARTHTERLCFMCDLKHKMAVNRFSFALDNDIVTVAMTLGSDPGCYSD